MAARFVVAASAALVTVACLGLAPSSALAQGQAQAKGPVFFVCNSQPANEVVATFFETDPPAARGERGDRTITGYPVRTASGAKYEGQNFSFWNKGKEAMVTWLGEQLTCRAE